MNYLAHLLLAQQNSDSRIGNLLGDFCHGTRLATFRPAVVAALYNHRAVDWFTDQHPQVRAARQLFSPSMRRFAPIALDMLFDYLLIKHWCRFYDSDFAQYKAKLYQQLEADLPLMPQQMASTLSAVIRQDWFGCYAELSGIQHALRRMACRGRLTGCYAAITEELPLHLPFIEQVFLSFFPALQQFVLQAAIEQHSALALERYKKATGKDQSSTA